MSRKSVIELTNMCLIYNEDSVLVQEKVGTKYKGGLVFPGGHVEEGESLQASMIREIKEETGLTIFHPKLCGVKDWIQGDGTRYDELMEWYGKSGLLYKEMQLKDKLSLMPSFVSGKRIRHRRIRLS